MGLSFDSIMGMALLLLGAVNTILIFEVLGRRGASDKLRLLHRWLGRIFAVSFLAFFVYMVPRVAHFANFPTHTVFHGVFGLALFPVVLGKVLIVKRYKNYMNSLPVLGFGILLLTFLVIGLGAAPTVFSLIHRH